jgi:hypothetical protein
LAMRKLSCPHDPSIVDPDELMLQLQKFVDQTQLGPAVLASRVQSVLILVLIFLHAVSLLFGS